MRAQINLLDEIIVDNFAGGGGASTGMELATGRPVEFAINHDPDAILMHQTNHPHTRHFCESVWDIDPAEICAGRPVGLAWFSPDCKHFSKAKGGKPVDKRIRGLAWIALRWAGTVRPRVMILENVEEFQTWGPVRRGKPVKAKAGQTFKKFVNQLETLGYTVEWRELVAADYGAPTTRKRFFLIARCDGRPIVWPEPTHAPRDSEEVKAGLKKPWRSAAEIIDWSLPCPSIFDSKAAIKEKFGLTAQRPLRPNTMRRVARGLDKFVLQAAEPFLVQVNHAGERFRGQDMEEPMPTVTGKHGYGVVQPGLCPWNVTNTTNSVGELVDKPLHTVTTAGNQMLVSPVLTAIGQTGGGERIRTVTDPTHTQCSKAEEMVIAPALIQYHTEQSEAVRGQEIDRPICTVDSANRYGLMAPTLVKYYGNDQHGLCSTVYKLAEGPELRRWPEVRELLNTYCGYHLAEDEVILLWIDGLAYYIGDIGLRMLTPRELYAANGFPPDYIIDRDYEGNVYGKSKQVARCGNAVPPPFATALVRANLPEWCDLTINTMQEFRAAIAV